MTNHDIEQSSSPAESPVPPSGSAGAVRPKSDAFTAGPPLHDAAAGDGGAVRKRRRRRGGRGRSRGPGNGPDGPAGGPLPAEGAMAEPAEHGHQGPAHEPAPRPDHAHNPKRELPDAFRQLGLEPALLHALAEINFVTPSEIQEKMIPVALTGADVIGQARTGTGKTAAFGLPMIQMMDPQKSFQALVVVPTRELAVQVEAELARFCTHKPIRTVVVYGGQKISGQIKKLGHHPHIVVGTPGRILDFVERGMLPLESVHFIVCDEVDRMFDIGFREDIRKILSGCRNRRQTIFVSATINDEIERMVRTHMREPQRVFTHSAEEQLTNPEATQYYVGVQPWDKQRALRMLIQAEKPDLAIVFCRTKRSVDKVAHGLEADGVNASPIHGDLLQNKRERVMRGFRTGKIQVLVATDLASRGIDVHEVTHVINYDIPEDPEVYVHRVGRTARMGATGKAITFVARGQAQLQTEIEKLCNNLMQEYRIPHFEPRPEPNARHEGPGGGQSAPQAAPKAPEPGPETNAEGYVTDSFANVNAEQSKRPAWGKFPVKRRR